MRRRPEGLTPGQMTAAIVMGCAVILAVALAVLYVETYMP
jgi:hypothetical protein